MDERLSGGSGLLSAVNEHNYDILDEIMDVDFIDNHMWFGLATGMSTYKDALKYIHGTLGMKAKMNVLFHTEDRIVTHVTLYGKHTGDFMGIPATGADVSWTTIEVYKVENNKLKSRIAVDDLTTLFAQLGMVLPS